MALHGNFMAESERAPGLLEQLREHGVRPRCEELLLTLVHLQGSGAVRPTVDLDMTVSLCFGSYFADYLRHRPGRTRGLRRAGGRRALADHRRGLTPRSRAE